MINVYKLPGCSSAHCIGQSACLVSRKENNKKLVFDAILIIVTLAFDRDTSGMLAAL